MSAQTFRKIPIQITAVQFTGDNVNEIWEAFGAAGIYGPTEENPDHLILTTTHGDPAPARAGDWVVPDSKPDTFYPIKPDVFEKTYLKIDGEVEHEVIAVQWPRISPEGTPITKSELKSAWQEIIRPVQEAGQNDDPNWKVLMAVFRSVYGVMPED